MSMITRCPACETMFRVVSDQLRISAGWVRCGQCDEIFDASAHLLDDLPAASSAAVSSTPPPQAIEVSEDEPLAAPAFESTVPAEALLLEEPPVATPLPPPYSFDFHELDLNLDDASTADQSFIELDTDAKQAQAIVEGHEGSDAIEVGWQSTGLEPIESAHEPVEAEPPANPAAFESPAEPISFLTNSHKNQVSSRPVWRWILIALSFFLSLGLILQGVYRERQRLAAFEPRLRPWLEQACDAMGCSVGPVLKIDAISVDSSTFVKLRADTYRLSFSLKNSATIAVAFPAIELTLTDALDRPFLRKVLRASDLRSEDAVLAAGAEWPLAIDIAVQSAALPDRVAGYRLIAFYP